MAIVSYSQLGEDLQIAYFLDRREDLTYIDIGALWPVELSNSYFFYKRGGWGLCVEPNPEAATLFQTDRPRDLFVPCGAGAAEGELQYMMHANPVFNTFSPERAEELRRKAAGRPGRAVRAVVTVPVKTLDQIVLDTGFAERVGESVDFLSIDAAGLELDIARGFSFRSPRPHLVLFEHRARRTASAELSDLIEDHGYRQVGNTRNTLYFIDNEN